MNGKEQNINNWGWSHIFMAVLLITAIMLCFVGFFQLFSLDLNLFLYLTLLQVAFFITTIGVIYFLLHKNHVSPQSFFGVGDFAKQFGVGVLAFLLMILSTTAIDFLCEHFLGVRSSDVYQNIRMKELIVMSALGLAFAPFAEEIFFRGFLQPVFVRSFGRVFGIIFVCLIFSCAHVLYLPNISATLGILAVGLILSTTKESTGSLIPCIVAHLLNNIIAVYFIIS